MNDELRDLIERTTQVQELAATIGWAYLTDRAHARVGAFQERLLGGSIRDHEEYKHVSGFVQGALYVLELPERMQNELEKAIEENGGTD